MWLIDFITGKSRKEEAERRAKEEAERKAKEEAERKAKEEAERKAKEEAERKAKEEAERKAKEEAERKAKEEAERKPKEDDRQRDKKLEDALASLNNSIKEDPEYKIRSQEFYVKVYLEEPISQSRQCQEFQNNRLLLNTKAERLPPASSIHSFGEVSPFSIRRMGFRVLPSTTIEDLNGREIYKWEGFVDSITINRYIEENHLLHQSEIEKELFTKSPSVSYIGHSDCNMMPTHPLFNKVRKVQVRPNAFFWGIWYNNQSWMSSTFNEKNKFVGYVLVEDWNVGNFVFMNFGSAKDPVLMEEERNEVLASGQSIKSSTFYKDYLYMGEIQSAFACTKGKENSKSRFGAVITNYGMFLGEFPAGYKMKKCIGKFYDLNGNIYKGEWNLPIDKDPSWKDDNGEFFPE